jgi:hypothetical protein
VGEFRPDELIFCEFLEHIGGKNRPIAVTRMHGWMKEGVGEVTKPMVRRKKDNGSDQTEARRNFQPFVVHEAGHGTGVNMENLFQPDILIQSQYLATHQRRFHQEPEKVLMLALLEDAIVCFQDNFGAGDRRKRALFEDAEQWILDRNSSYIFSFENICEVLGLDAGYLREGLMRWKATQGRSQAKEQRRRLAS